MQQVFGADNHYIQDEGWSWEAICTLCPVDSGEKHWPYTIPT